MVVELGDEDGRHTLEDGRSVHVDGGSDGEDEATDALVHAVVFLYRFHHGGQRRRAGGTRREKLCVDASVADLNRLNSLLENKYSPLAPARTCF